MADKKKESAYVGIKPHGLGHWLWFKREAITRESGYFEGRNGWGLNGDCTSVRLMESLIEGEIESESPQYLRND